MRCDISITDGKLTYGRFDIHLALRAHVDEWNGCIVATIDKIGVTAIRNTETNKEAYIIHQ